MLDDVFLHIFKSSKFELQGGLNYILLVSCLC